jgi:hypothetical protein
MRHFITLLFFALTIPAAAQVSVIRPDVIETISGEKNYIRNPSAVRNARDVTVSSATIARDTTSGNRLDGVASFVCDSSAQNGFCEWTTTTINDGDTSGNCEASFLYKGDGTRYVLRLTDGTSALVSTSLLTNETTWRKATVNYPCGTTRRVQLFQSDTGNGAALNVGKVYYGKATNIGNVDPVGDWQTFTPTGSWTTNTTYTGQWRRVGDSAEVNVSIVLSGAPTSANLSINLPPGLVIDTTKLAGFGANGKSLGFGSAGDNGVQGYPVDVQYNNTTSVTVNPFNASATYATYSTILNQAIPFTFGATDVVTVRFSVPIVGWSSQSAIRADQSNYDWTSYTPTFTGFGTVTSPECYHKRAGSDLILRCKATSGTSTATEARVSLPGSLVSAGTNLIPSIQKAGDLTRGVSAGSSFSFNVLIEPNVSYVTFGVQGSAAAGMTKVNGSALVGNTEVFSFTARIPIAGWTENQAAPLLVGSVTSNSQGLERVERAFVFPVCTASPCTVALQSGSWVSSVTRTSTGNYSVNIASGTFSNNPTCVVSAGGTTNPTIQMNSITPTLVSFITATGNSGAVVDTYLQIICMGPR